MSTEVRVPTLGESVSEATVATWFKKPGDAVSADEMLCELETDKVTVEVPSPASGTLGEIVAGEGETVGVDALLAMLTEGAGKEDASKSEAPKDDKAKKPRAASSGNGDKGNTDVKVPTLGESVSEATVSTWFKQVGDSVTQDEVLCELETDKVSVEVPSPVAGTLTEILAQEGETVQAGGRLAILSGSADGTVEPQLRPEPAAAPDSGDKAAEPSGKDVEDAPSAKKAMAEKGVTRDQVQGSGRDGRVMKEDVARAESAKKAPAAEAPAPGPAPA
ncbi:MAG: biotin/lipoyl-containing protein, partial [Roseovarius sp.]